MLGMMIPTPIIRRKSVRKRIDSARLSSTAPPPQPEGPMIGTPRRDVNHGDPKGRPWRLGPNPRISILETFVTSALRDSGPASATVRRAPLHGLPENPLGQVAGRGAA